MKKSLITYSIIIVILLVISFFSSRTNLQAQSPYSMYGNIWYLQVDSCAPPGYYLHFKVIYEAGPDTFGPYYSLYNCSWGYNTSSGQGWYKVLAWHVNANEDTVTMGFTRFRWIGPYERHDFKVYDWSSGGD